MKANITVMALAITVGINTALAQSQSVAVDYGALSPARNWPTDSALQRTDFGRRFSSGGHSQDFTPPVLIHFAAAAPSAMQETEEDLLVMTRLIDRTLENGLGAEATPTRMGVRLLYTSDGRSVRALYVEGFGVLFMIKVNFPLVGPPAASDKSSQKEADSDWEKAKRDVLGNSDLDVAWEMKGHSDVIFEPTQIEKLKRLLVQALKNASNIRHIKPDEFVSVSVFGNGAPVFADTGTGRYDVWDGGRQAMSARDSVTDPLINYPRAGRIPSKYRRGSGQGTVMTLRAKKADIDAFAAAKLTLEHFNK